MNSNSSSDGATDIDRLDDLAEEFVARYRAGQRPSLTEIIALHPDLADQIRELLPTLAMMEEARVESSQTGFNEPLPNPGLPERIAEYRILREVGRGGMGIVYEALQESLGRLVALKILPTHSLLDKRQLQRFQREARSAARLHHTNIVPVFGVGSHDGLNYYAMQFIRGRSLDQVLTELKRSRGIAKENNELPGRTSDAGSTRVQVSAVSLASDLAHGTFHSQSKAQSKAQPIAQSKRDQDCQPTASEPATNEPTSDLYQHGRERNSSLPDSGYSYWLGLARVGAQVADALAYAHSQGVLHRDVKPSNLLLDTDGTVWVTDFGLAKDIQAEESRSGSDLTNLTRTGDIVGTLRYMAPELLRGQSDWRSDIYSLGATLYELVTLRPVFDDADRHVFMRRLLHEEPRRPRSIDPTIPIDLETIVVKALAKEPQDRYSSAEEMAEDLRRFLGDRPIRARRVSTWERAWRTCRRNPLIASLSFIVALLVVALSAGFQMASWIRSERDRAVGSAERALRAEKSAQESLQRALDAERDAKVRSHLTQAIVQRKSGSQGHRSRAIEEIEQAMKLGPSNALQQQLRNELVATLALTDTVPARTWESPHGIFAVDQQYQCYARATGDGAISVRRLSDDQEVRKLQRAPGPDNRASLKFSPDGNYLASFTFDQHVMVWRMNDGTLVLDDEGCNWEVSYDFTPDSRSIILGHAQEVVVRDLQTDEILSRWPVEFAPWQVACGPRDDLVAITPEGNNSSRKLQVFKWSNKKLIAEHVAPKWVYDIAWHPSGRSLAYGCGDTNIYLWNVGATQPYRKLSGSLAYGVRVAFSHDGSLLASSSWGQEFFLWEVNTGEVLCSARHSIPCLTFSPDDKQIALFRDGARIGIYNIERSDVFRYFFRGGNPGEGNGLVNAVFNRDGRLLLVGTEKGISICEYPSGEERAFAPVGRTAHLRCDGEGNLLVTSGVLHRWPIQSSDGSAQRYVVGPAEALPYRSRSEFDISRDGSAMIIAGFDEATIVHADHPDRHLILSPHEDCRYVAISQDGKLAATASHFGSKVKVWDATTARLLATLPVESSLVKFSPDGHWLATPTGARHLWRVGTWEPGPDLGGLVTGFSGDGRIVAVDDLSGSVHLLDPDTGREYVRLDHPRGYGADRYLFTEDDQEIVAVGTARPSGFAWNLCRVRQALAAHGLDWDLPPYPPSTIEPKQAVEVELRIRDRVKSHEELAKERIARCRERIKAKPNDSLTCNELAWELLIAPEALRDCDEALELATRALAIQPDDANCRNTMGVALYRSGRYRDAVDCLAKNLSVQNDEGLPFDLYFLAMCHFRLGDRARGEEAMIWANRWWASVLKDSPEIDPLVREQLLDIQKEAEQTSL